jgi:hypothetical protein
MGKLEGRENNISQQRDKKLEEAREKRFSKNTIKSSVVAQSKSD